MPQPFLHEIIVRVLREAGRPMTRAEIAVDIEQRGLWLRPEDNLPPPAGQIGLRVKDHTGLFEKAGKLISLKHEPASSGRMFRLTWNTTGWQYPVRHKWRRENQGKTNVAFENQYGFGGEEWLFNPRYLQDGYQYGYIRGVEDLADDVRLIATAYLYTFNQATRERFIAGIISQLEVIKARPEVLRIGQKLYDRYAGDVEAELEDVKADVRGLAAEGFLPNVRFRITDGELFQEMQPAPGLAGYQYNRFMPYIVDETLQEIIDGALPEDEFIFRPGVAASTKDFERNNTRATRTVRRLHTDITRALEKYLAPEYTNAKKNLSVEQTPFGMNKADVVITHKPGIISIMEVKTSGLARKNIREALGQLLDYACWHPHLKIQKLIIISPSVLSVREKAHLAQICKQIAIPVGYWQYLANPAKGSPAFIEVIS